MSLIPARTMAGVIALITLALSSLTLPPYLDRGVLQMGFMLIAGAILAEGVIRRSLIIFDALTNAAGILFAVVIASAFFLSDLDKFELGVATLTRLLWPIVFYAAFLAATGDRQTRAALAGIFVVGLAIFAVRMRVCYGAESTARLLISAAAGLAAAGAAALAGSITFAPSFLKKLVCSIAFAGVVGGAWLVVGASSLPRDEIEIVRRGFESRDALITVAKRCVDERPVIGHGSGSIKRMFLRYRPANATMRGVPDRLPVPMESFYVLTAETGYIGFGMLLLFAGIAFTRLFCRKRDKIDYVLAGLFAAIFAHEIQGGGWFLLPAGGLLLFGVMGLMAADPDEEGEEENEQEMPVSFFVMVSVTLAGIFLWHQIFWWRTVALERRIPEIQRLLAESKFDLASDAIDRCLTELDPHRNELLSMLVGALSNSNRIGAALQNSQLILRRDPDYPSVKNNIGTFFVMLGQTGEAIPYVQETADHEPTTENWAKLGHLYAVTGRVEEAKAAFFKSIDLFPREVDILLAKSPKLTDTHSYVDALFQSAHFSSNTLLRNFGPALGELNQERIVNTYNTQRNRMKEQLGWSRR
jgi:Tfp pilus assembly protein PilF